MPRLTPLALALLACAALSACGSKGGEGESCNSGGALGPLYCDQGLICNGAAGYKCERAGSRHENEACDADKLCATGLWCPTLESKCSPWLSEGDSCDDPLACGPNLVCLKTLRGGTPTCAQAKTDGGIASATVIGTLTLPGAAPAKGGMVEIYSVLPPDGTIVASTEISTIGGLSLDYRLEGVPAGTYFLFAFLDVDRSGGTSSTPGDYAAWFGHNGDGNPPAAASAVVPDAGTVLFNFSLVLR